MTDKEKWTKYLSERTASYEFRARTRSVTTASWFSEQHNPGQQDTLVGAWKRGTL